MLAGEHGVIELTRSETPPPHPVVVRADGLRVDVLDAAPGRLMARVAGDMAGEVVVQASAATRIHVDGIPVTGSYEPATGCHIIAHEGIRGMEVSVG
jgi:hypothetical protein